MVGEDHGGAAGVPASALGIEGLVEPRQIGEGGNAIVYRAYQPSLDRHVAVKVLKGLVDDDAKRRFDRERRAMGRLSEHDGIVTVYASGFSTRGEPYLIMPLLPGSLDDDLRSGPLPWPEAVAIMTEVCETVGVAHERGVVHRDLKPGNIMRSPTGRPLVADFGIARLMDASSSFKSTAITLTPAYSPPEALEATLASARADVYSLGATLFALIAGHAPFADRSGDASLLVLMRRILEEPVPDLRPTIPDALQAVLQRAMAKDPAERFDDATQLAGALRGLTGAASGAPDGAAATRPVASPSLDEAHDRVPVGPAPPGTAGTGRRRRLLVAGALCATLAIVAALVLTVGRSDDDGGAFADGSAAATPTAAPTQEPTEAAPTPAPTELTPAVAPTPAVDPLVDPEDEPPVAPVRSGRVGPSDFEPYATTIVGGDAEAWTVVPRSQETVVLVDPATLDAAGAADFGFFAPIVTVGSGWIAGAGTDGQLGAIDLVTGENTRLDLDRTARHLATDGDLLWVVTAADDGSDAMLHRFDRRSLAEEATTEVGDFVLHLDAEQGRVWTAAGSTVKSFDAATLTPMLDTSIGIGPIDDLDAFGDAVWVSGGVFASDLSDQELARGSVVRLDAATGAADPVRNLTDGLSIFERATVAATGGGAWVTVETTNEAFFVADDGMVGPVVELPDDVQDAEVIAGALWVLAGGSGSGQLWAIELASS